MGPCRSNVNNLIGQIQGNIIEFRSCKKTFETRDAAFKKMFLSGPSQHEYL